MIKKDQNHNYKTWNSHKIIVIENTKCVHCVQLSTIKNNM